MTLVYCCVYLVFHWGDIVEKVLPKLGVQKKDGKSGCPYLQTFKPSAGYALNSHKKIMSKIY